MRAIETQATNVSPSGHAAVFVPDATHGLGSLERVFAQGRFVDLKAQTRFFWKRKIAVYHAHRRETEPVLSKYSAGL